MYSETGGPNGEEPYTEGKTTYHNLKELKTIAAMDELRDKQRQDEKER